MDDDGYAYHVFLSYRRHKLTDGWMRGVVARIRYWLSEELTREEARVFFDKDSVKPGEDFRNTIQRALRTSRCILAVWSPRYFRSRWCLAEWATFVRRQQLIDQDRRLVIGLRYCDGDSFPRQARRVQMVDVSRYTSTVESFWDSARADEFDQLLRDLAQQVKRIVANVPAFQRNWPVFLPPELEIPDAGRGGQPPGRPEFG